jgi:ATP-binding cassette subfamily B protein
LRRALAINAMISQGPRFAIEAAGIIAIALVALWMSLQPGGIVAALPVLGALALGSQRLLPLVQQAYNGWSSALGNAQVLRDIAAIIDVPVAPEPPSGGALPFHKEISLNGVSFGYAGGKSVLDDAWLSIPRGSRIGVVGPTGGGKSTLLDLIMGLLEPDRGEIRVDGRALDASSRPLWRSQIAHVPQSIFLLDDTIAANIAFGIRRAAVDLEKVRACAAAAQLGDFIHELPAGLATRVGERGIRLSGGQRQRIGLARALYKGAPVLILDEATSALDETTEAAVIESIMALGRGTTLIMVAHRRSTLDGCERILHVAGGRVAEESPPLQQSR